MYLIYAPQGSLQERIGHLLSSRLNLAFARDWKELEELTAKATCTVIAIDRFDNPIDLERLRMFRQRYAIRPLIVVTQGDPSNIRKLKDISIDGLLFLPEIGYKLQATIRQHCSADFLRRLAEDLRRNERLPPTLREALIYLFTSDRPPRSVDELARIIGCDRRTLGRQLRAASASCARLTVKDVIDWVLLLRAILRKGPREPWSSIANQYGIHEHTLSRISRRLLHRRIGSIESPDQRAVVNRFLQVIACLTHDAIPDLQFLR